MEQHSIIDLDHAMEDGAALFQNDSEPPKETVAEPSQHESIDRPDDDGGDKKNDDWSPRFRSHADAEEGYRNIQAKTSKVEEENARLRQQLAEFEAQRDRQRQEDMQADIRRRSVKEYSDALQKIQSLDPEAPDHNEKVAEIWAETHLNVSSFRPTGDNQTDDGNGGASPKADADVTIGKAREYVDNQLASAGLDDDEKLIFFAFASSAPDTGADGTPIGLEEQTAMTIEKTKQFLADKRAKFLQEFDQPMGRSGPTGPEGGRASSRSNRRIMSLDDALQEADAARTLS